MKIVAWLKRRTVAIAAAALATTLIALAASYASASPVPEMDAANQAFGEGSYAKAAAGFESLIAAHGDSAPLLFDLGNAYLRDKKPVRAILAYERAEILAPRDAAIAANLEIARASANVPDEGGPITRASHYLTMSTWTWIATGAFWLAVGAVFAASRTKRGRGALVMLSSCGAIVALTSAAATAIAGRDLSRGIVMDPAPVLVSPFDSAQSDFALPAGASVELGRSRDRYIFIHDGRGRSGWIERAQIEPIFPRSS